MSNEFIVRNGLVSKGNIDIQGNALTTTILNGDVSIQPNGTGKVRLGSLKVPNADGTNGQILGTDGAGNMIWYNAGAGEANTAASLGTGTDGHSLVGTKTGTVLNFLRVKAGNNITITDEANDIKIDVSGISAVGLDGQWNSILSKPTFATVATTGSYSDLINKPTLALSSMSDVNLGSLVNNNVLKYNTATSKWVNSTISAAEVSGLATVATTGSYGSLTGVPTLGTAAFVNTGTSSGNVPVLDGSGKLPTGVLPSLSISDVFVVADITARNGLTVQTGDVAIVTGTSQTFIYDGTVWQEIKTPGTVAPVSSVNGKTGAVSLVWGDFTGQLGVSQGGTGLSTITANNILIGNGTSAVSTIAPAAGYLFWTGSAFAWQTPAAGISSVQQDTSPKLGGNLDLNGNAISSTSAITITSTGGNISLVPATGTGLVQIGGVDYSRKTAVAIVNNQASALAVFTYAATTNDAIFVDYIIRRSATTRAGTIIMVNDGTTVTFSDAGPEIGDVGVTFTASVSGGNVSLNYTSTNTGTAGTMTFQIRKYDA